MATQLAREHGGDGGGRDPTRNSNHISTSCESSVPKKNTRKGAKHFELFKAFEANGNMPISINFDFATGEVVGPHSKWFPRWATSMLEDHTVFEYESWQNVPDEHKLQIYTGLFSMFDLASWQKPPAPHWHKVQASIDTYCASRYSDKKCKLRVRFENAGGFKDIQKGYGACPKGYDKNKWRSLIDNLFTQDKFIKRSKVNKANRAKQQFPSLQGSKSISSQRYDEIQETGSSSYIGNWAKNHKRNGVFVNEAAEKTYGKIDKANTDLQCEVGTEGAVDEGEVLRRALGERSGYIRGVGKRLKHLSPMLTSSSYIPEPPATSKKLEALEEKTRQQQEEIDKMSKEMAQMRELFFQHMGGQSSTHAGSNMNQDSQNDENGHESEDD